SIMATISGSNFGGARASGGPVDPSHNYLVGERGPEMFVPSVPGTIVPNDALTAKPEVNLRLVNAFDVGVIGDYLGSDAGDELVMNVVRRNADSIRQMTVGA